MVALTAEQVEQSARIEIDVFSGRPNPAWDLGPAEARTLAALIAAPRERTASPPAADGLGFRGFVVTLRNHDAQQIRVVGDVIDDGRGAFLDRDRQIETFILSVMPEDLRRQLADVLPR